MCRTIRAGRCAGASARSGRFVDDPAYPRLVADRQTVELLTEALDIDFFAAQACAGAEAAATGELARAASSFRGPLLADLDLPANGEFHTWLLGLREDARKLQSQILRALTERLARNTAGSPALCARAGAHRPL